ncbi:nSTAND1 domain-containing NTPase [Streptomyces sp. HM190]|uniref:nSTAND1 domain-containing NTPase n=1 Tax=Streptomyces sp. HM190 TaxID=2695266 RepID=UPI001357E1BD|nr:trypsin-like peptidase domain-containing protein [Streptomyces sp. HM190]
MSALDRARATVVQRAVAQVLDQADDVVGSGFLVDDRTLMTCAHVVSKAGYGPGDTMKISFPCAPGRPQIPATVLAEAWREPVGRDVCVLRLLWHPEGLDALSLDVSTESSGHVTASFGYPNGAGEVRLASGEVIGWLERGVGGPGPDGGSGPLLQLAHANDITLGFSGGPVVDTTSGLVIGMITAITAGDANDRLREVAFATPAQTLYEVWPRLVARAVPYRGLEAFTEEHAQWFHGRKHTIRIVLETIRQHQRAVLLLGPSGSGKSSLVRAGLLPALQKAALPSSDRWLPIVTRPGEDLFAELERAGLPGAGGDLEQAVVRRLGSEPGHQRVLLVIDQFEELLTQPTVGRNASHVTPGAALEHLLRAVRSGAALNVLIIMRDDFYSQLAARAPGLLEAAKPGLVNMPALVSRDELEDIVTLPAVRAGARLEDGLVDRIVSDVLAGDHSGPAAGWAPVTLLPPLQLALSQLWERMEDGRLTHDAYRAVGEVTGALAAWCNSTMEELAPGERRVARRMLTALVRPADDASGVPPVRQQRSLPHLHDLVGDVPEAVVPVGFEYVDVDAVRDHLAERRIITVRTAFEAAEDGTSVETPVAELVHDTLLRDWPELSGWVREDSRFLIWLGRAEAHRRRWASSEDPDDLLRGSDLTEGKEWSAKRRLLPDIRRFLKESERRQQAGIRRMRRINTLLLIALVLTIAAAGVAVNRTWQANEEASRAESQKLISESELLQAEDPDQARLKSLAAWQLTRGATNARARYAMLAAVAQPAVASFRMVGGVDGPVAFSPDGKVLAVGGSTSGRVGLWSVSTHRKLAELRTGLNGVTAIAFRPDSMILAVAGRGRDSEDPSALLDTLLAGSVQLWSVQNHQRIGKTGDTDHPATSVSFEPDGKSLVTVEVKESTSSALTELTGGGIEGFYVSRWEVESLESKDHRTVFTVGEVQSAVLSPDAREIAVVSVVKGALAKTDVLDVKSLQTRTLDSDSVTPRATAFGSRAAKRLLVTGHLDGTVRLWDSGNQQIGDPIETGDGAVMAVAVSSDCETLAVATNNKDADDGTVRFWDMRTRRPLGTPLTTSALHAFAFNPRDGNLASSHNSGTAWLWDVAGRRPSHVRETEGIGHITAFAPDGMSVAYVADGSIRLQPLQADRKFRTVPFQGAVDDIQVMAVLPRSHLLVTVDDFSAGDRKIRYWSLTKGLEIFAKEIPDQDDVNTLAVDRDETVIATGHASGTVRLWDLKTHCLKSSFNVPSDERVTALAFRPDGSELAVGSQRAGRAGQVRQYSVQGGRETETALTTRNGDVVSLAYSPGGELLAVGGKEAIGAAIERVQIWHLPTRRPVGNPLTYDISLTAALNFKVDEAGQNLLWSTGTEVLSWNVSGLIDTERSLCVAAGASPAAQRWKKEKVSGIPFEDLCPGR